MAVIKNPNDNKCGQGQVWEGGEFNICTPLAGNVNSVQPLWKQVWRFLKKLKIVLLYNGAMALLGIYLKESKTMYLRDICTSMFTMILFIEQN